MSFPTKSISIHESFPKFFFHQNTSQMPSQTLSKHISNAISYVICFGLWSVIFLSVISDIIWGLEVGCDLWSSFIFLQAYVTQSDDLIGTLTVNETVYYSASLRLSSKIPRAEKKAIVESTIREMGLMDCRNTPVGNWHLRGLSGGERRRLSIALEILTRPRLLFLDEPTSGLDRSVGTYPPIGTW